MDDASRSLRRMALLVAGCFFMQTLDGTIVTTAAPRIGAALHVPSTSIGLVIAAYMVTGAVLIPVSGWSAQRWGARPVFIVAIATFTLASAACAGSTSFAELVVFRVLQGVGGAMMVPVGRLIVLARTQKHEMLRIVSFLVWPALVAPVVAPLIGGAIITYASWRWLFFINVPIGVVALALAPRIIRAPHPGGAPPLDWAGVALTSGGLATTTYMAYLLSETRVRWQGVGLLAGTSAVLLSLAVVHLVRAPHPVVNLRLVRTQTLRVALTSGFLFWAAITAVPFLLTLLFQNAFGWSPVKSGSVVLFLFGANIATKPTTSALLRRFGFRTVLIGATTGAAITMIGMALIHAGTPILAIGAVAVLSGMARSVSMTAYIGIAFSDTVPEDMRDANTLQATVQNLGVGLGVPLGAILLRIGGWLSASPPGHAGAYSIGFMLLALTTLLATAGVLRLPRDAGKALTARNGDARAAMAPNRG